MNDKEEHLSNDNLVAAIKKSIIDIDSDVTAHATTQYEASYLDELQKALLGQQIKDIIHYRELRKKYANRVFFFMCIWSALSFLILLFHGCCKWFHLSDTILVTLTGGTTVSVIGLVGFIIQGLFNSKNNNSIK